MQIFFATDSARDRDLSCLKKFANLQTLYLDGTQITDAGLLHLKDLTKLKTLWLSGTHATDHGIAELRRALPNLTIYGP